VVTRRSLKATGIPRELDSGEMLEKETLMLHEDISVTEYAPDAFAFLRLIDGYDNHILKQSLNPKINKNMVFKAGESKGKSGSFFFFSKDQKFIIKTMTQNDFLAFMRLFRTYFRHVCTNPKSLLARIYGVYSVTMGDQKPVKLVVMANTMRLNSQHTLKYVFDLKGSLINRLVKDCEHLKPSYPLKDQNLLKIAK
jgi:hypothetical protein